MLLKTNQKLLNLPKGTFLSLPQLLLVPPELLLQALNYNLLIRNSLTFREAKVKM